MGTSIRPSNDTGCESFLLTLKKEQETYHEGSFEWADIQSKINQIIAQNYLEYLNR